MSKPERPVLRPFYAFDRLLGWIEQGALLLLLAAMIVLGMVNIILQNAERLHLPVPYSIAGGLMWADPALRWMVLWVGMIGAMVATQAGRHLNMDALARLLPNRFRRWVDVLVNLAAAACCSVLLIVAVPYVAEEQQAGGDAIVGP
ncbi:MAG: TRAP transporter small permease subunit, partial [Cyanobacteria bacterium REEB65]|nr:TRAP transporter small permease subunit [Cyanobacteria bacterium REEB65]